MKKEYYVIFEQSTEDKFKTKLTVVDLNKTLPNGNKEVVIIYLAEAAEETHKKLIGEE